MPPQQQLVALDVDLVQLEAVALVVQGDDRLDRLLAEVAARAASRRRRASSSWATAAALASPLAKAS